MMKMDFEKRKVTKMLNIETRVILRGIYVDAEA